ncbi:uncharacterized protein [Antedon mediterranea]|uniref:uncharacterized protein n=1 Tax=Antedon mediterranea TaxID=105859 RepID=UPI003AF580EB
MELLLTLICVLVAIILLYAAYNGKQFFMQVDVLCCTIFGLVAIVLPGLASKLETKKPDDVVVHMVRASGCVLIASAYVFNQVQHSADATVRVVLMVSRLVTCTLVAAGGLFQRSRSSSSTDYSLMFIYFNVAFAVIYIYFLLTSREWGGHTQLDTKVNLHLRIDFFATLVFGIFFYAFPEWLLSAQVGIKITRLQEYSSMLFGAFMIGSSIVSSYAPGFIDEENQRAQFQGRIMQNIFLLLAMIYTQFSTSSWTVYHVYFGISGCFLWTFNAIGGLASPREIDEVKSM